MQQMTAPRATTTRACRSSVNEFAPFQVERGGEGSCEPAMVRGVHFDLFTGKAF